jgi:hypothetical protein
MAPEDRRAQFMCAMYKVLATASLSIVSAVSTEADGILSLAWIDTLSVAYGFRYAICTLSVSLWVSAKPRCQPMFWIVTRICFWKFTGSGRCQR